MEVVQTEAFRAQALMLLMLCTRHVMNCRKAVFHFLCNRDHSGMVSRRRLRKKRRMIINCLMDLQQVQRPTLNGGRTWRLPRFRKHWFEREVMEVSMLIFFTCILDLSCFQDCSMSGGYELCIFNY